MRVSVSNWQTSPEDVLKTIAGVERVLEHMREGRQLRKDDVGTLHLS